MSGENESASHRRPLSLNVNRAAAQQAAATQITQAIQLSNNTPIIDFIQHQQPESEKEEEVELSQPTAQPQSSLGDNSTSNHIPSDTASLVVPSASQPDDSFNTSGAEALATIVSHLWDLYDQTESDGEMIITQSAYTLIYLRIAESLYKHVDREEALRSAAIDWGRDTKDTNGRMNLSTYTRSILEVAKQWTQDRDGWQGQANFLQGVYNKLILKKREANAAIEHLSQQATSLWRHKYGASGQQPPPRGPSNSRASLVARATRLRINRRRDYQLDASNRVNTRGAKLFAHTTDHEANLTLKSLNASGPPDAPASAITLYTPWQPTWSSESLSSLDPKFQTLCPPQTEPIYHIRSRKETEKQIVKQELEHRLDQQWKELKSIRPQTERDHIASGIVGGIHSSSYKKYADDELEAKKLSQFGVSASSLPIHSGPTGTTHISFIPFSTPTFPIKEGLSLTTREQSCDPEPSLQPGLQPRPPAPARIRPHSAAATRLKHVIQHKQLLRELTSAHDTPKTFFQKLQPKEESEIERVRGPVVGFPLTTKEKEEMKAHDTSGTAIGATLVPVSVPPNLVHDAYRDEMEESDLINPAQKAGHIHTAPFQPTSLIRSIERPRSAVERNTIQQSEPLILKESQRERPLLLMSGQPARTPFVKAAVEEEKTNDSSTTIRRERPLSAQLGETIQRLNNLSRFQPPSFNTTHQTSSATFSISRPQTAGPSRYVATPASVFHSQRSQPQFQSATESSNTDGESKPQDRLPTETPLFTNPPTAGSTIDNTFLTSLANEPATDDPQALFDQQFTQQSSDATNDDVADFIMESRVKRELEEEEKKRASGDESASPSEEQRLILHDPATLGQAAADQTAPFADLRPTLSLGTATDSQDGASGRPKSVHKSGLDPTILQPHPSLAMACLTIPPTRPATWTSHQMGGHSLGERIQALDQRAFQEKVHSWSWFSRLVSEPEPISTAVSLIPSDTSKTLDEIRQNSLRKSIFNSRQPDVNWLVTREEEEKEQNPPPPTRTTQIRPRQAQAAGPLIPAVHFDTLPPTSVPAKFVRPASAKYNRSTHTLETPKTEFGQANIHLDIYGSTPLQTEDQTEAEERTSPRLTDTQSSVPLMLGRTSQSRPPPELQHAIFSGAFAKSEWKSPSNQLHIRYAPGYRPATAKSARRPVVKDVASVVDSNFLGPSTEQARLNFRQPSHQQHRPISARYHTNNSAAFKTVQQTDNYTQPEQKVDPSVVAPVRSAPSESPVDPVPSSPEPVLTNVPLQFPGDSGAVLMRIRSHSTEPTSWIGRKPATGLVQKQPIAKKTSTVKPPERIVPVERSMHFAESNSQQPTPNPSLSIQATSVIGSSFEHFYDADSDSVHESDGPSGRGSRNSRASRGKLLTDPSSSSIGSETHRAPKSTQAVQQKPQRPGSAYHFTPVSQGLRLQPRPASATERVSTSKSDAPTTIPPVAAAPVLPLGHEFDGGDHDQWDDNGGISSWKMHSSSTDHFHPLPPPISNPIPSFIPNKRHTFTPQTSRPSNNSRTKTMQPKPPVNPNVTRPKSAHPPIRSTNRTNPASTSPRSKSPHSPIPSSDTTTSISSSMRPRVVRARSHTNDRVVMAAISSSSTGAHQQQHATIPHSPRRRDDVIWAAAVIESAAATSHSQQPSTDDDEPFVVVHSHSTTTPSPTPSSPNKPRPPIVPETATPKDFITV